MYFVLPSSLNSTEIGIGPRSHTYIHPQDIRCRTNFFFVFLGARLSLTFSLHCEDISHARELINKLQILCAILVVQTLSLSLSLSFFLSFLSDCTAFLNARS